MGGEGYDPVKISIYKVFWDLLVNLLVKLPEGLGCPSYLKKFNLKNIVTTIPVKYLMGGSGGPKM